MASSTSQLHSLYNHCKDSSLTARFCLFSKLSTPIAQGSKSRPWKYKGKPQLAQRNKSFLRLNPKETEQWSCFRNSIKKKKRYYKIQSIPVAVSGGKAVQTPVRKQQLVREESQNHIFLLWHVGQLHVLPHEVDEHGGLQQAAQPLKVALCKERKLMVGITGGEVQQKWVQKTPLLFRREQTEHSQHKRRPHRGTNCGKTLCPGQ